MPALERLIRVVALATLCASWASRAGAAEWFVAPGGTGTGTEAAPLGRIQAAIQLAQPGDTVTVLPGSYAETLRTVRDGMPPRPIRVRAETRGSVVVSMPGR